jgi:putative transposase
MLGGMPRVARIVIPDIPYHITQRGNRREDVFFSDEDRLVYLKLLAQYATLHGLDVKAYCLMTNHVHLVAVPATANALSGALKPVHLRYTQHVNWTQNVSGRLWQGRFFSCALDDAHFLQAVRYVERNPVRAGLVAHAEDYPWSSAAAHCGLRVDALVSKAPGPARDIGDWKTWLREPDDETANEALRRNTRTGRPLGGESFLNLLEHLLGHTVRPRKAGRPAKNKPKETKYG